MPLSFPWRTRYRPLLSKQEELEAGDDIEKDDESIDTAMEYRSERRHEGLLLGLMLLLSFLAGASLMLVGTRILIKTSDLECFEQTSMWSPIASDIEMTYHKQAFEVKLMSGSIYRDRPGPAVDAAWDDLGIRLNNLTVSQAEGHRAGIPSTALKTPPEHGAEYVVNLEVFHQLGCLNFLRQVSYHNYDYYLAQHGEGFTDSEDIIMAHTGHCIDLIRQRLMCTADVTLLPFTWAASTPWVPHPKQPIAMPDFDHHNHMCRDFDTVVEWARERQKPELFRNPKVKYTVQEGERVVAFVP